MIVVEQISSERFGAYSGISPEFTVTSVFECDFVSGGSGGLLLREKPVSTPYVKYDLAHDENTRDWAKRYDLGTWGIFLATDDGRPVGGAAVCPRMPDMVASQPTDGVAVLFDIRVAPAHRGRGVGTALLKRCIEWAKDRGHKVLSIETQNNNVPACRFYAKAGCELADIRRFAYAHCPECAHEAMLIWQLTL